MENNFNVRSKTREGDDEEELKYLNKICIKFLRLLGILYESKKESYFLITFTKILTISFCYGLILSFDITIILHMFITETNVNVKFRKMPMALYNVVVFIKYNCLLMNQKNIVRCIEYLEDDLERIIDPYHRDIIKSKVRYGKRFFVVICVFMHVTVLYWRICVPLVKGNIVTAENITIRPLPSTGYYFNLFDDQVSPFYEVIFILQCLEGLVTVYINIIICTLAVIFVMHACCQLEIFINLLESVVANAESDKENTNFKLAVAVKHHIRVRRFLQKIETTMNPLYFMDIFGCGTTLIFLAYCLMMDWNAHQLKNVAPYVISLSSITFQIFVFCFVGEQLTLQDEKVALKSCVLEWNRIPYKDAKNVIPIVILSNCRLKITAGSIVELSLHTFGQVIKTSLGYCNMMRTIMQ